MPFSFRVSSGIGCGGRAPGAGGQARARIVAQCAWAQEHPGRYKVLHKSKVNQRLGMLSLRINEPDLTWPPAAQQIDRFLSKLVGLPAKAGRPRSRVRNHH